MIDIKNTIPDYSELLFEYIADETSINYTSTSLINNEKILHLLDGCELNNDEMAFVNISHFNKIIFENISNNDISNINKEIIEVAFNRSLGVFKIIDGNIIRVM